MKTVILGAGALGSVIGGLLAIAGRDVALWDVNDTHLDAIRKKGLRIDGPKGTEVLQLPAIRPEEADETPDLIILLTKTIHTEAALAGVQKHIDAGAHVLSLQNGLGNAERIAAIVPPDRVLYGCTMMPGRFIEPGHVASQGKGYAVFKSLTENGLAFAKSAAVETDMVTLEVTDSTDQIIWQKAAFNCAMNASCALTDARVGALSQPEMFKLLTDVSGEAVAVANALGVTASHSEVIDQIRHALEHHTEHKPSMLQDIEAGRPTEIDSLCGEVARLAEQNNLSAPLNTALASLVRVRSRTSAEANV
ncbi:ketopantoate reductase family protein [Ruegeria sp. SCP11]|uniref:ketopantoate reductase family protein n=1 Tax=Ruegeria sp. SCP11 TaxID=3141378 RepID=UPI0033394E49